MRTRKQTIEWKVVTDRKITREQKPKCEKKRKSGCSWPRMLHPKESDGINWIVVLLFFHALC